MSDSPKTNLENMADTISPFLKRQTLCNACAHKEICKMVDDSPVPCEHYSNAEIYKVYPSIYDLFEPIFNWIETHYPSHEVRFIVDHSSAQMYIEHKVAAYSKEIRNYACVIGREKKTEETADKSHEKQGEF